jgi:hypothetical protein
MRNAETRLIDTANIESRFIFAQEIKNISKIADDEGQELAFHRNANGNHIVFTKDLEGYNVAIEHCIDGTKIFHLSQDSKGLPAMHEFRPDGAETMYLLDNEKKLEKMIETKSNGDKITSWFYPTELLVQEQRQTGGIVFRLFNDEGNAVIWLKVDGEVEASGEEKVIERIKYIFSMYLDGADI